MNVIISNKYQSLLGSLDIDVIKSINGVFTVDELIAQFSSFYFNKLILDITAIKDYTNINVMQNLSVNFDMSKVILLLDDSETVNSPVYLSQLVSMGIYNFTADINAITYLINNPNTYKDVAKYHNIDGFEKQPLNEKSIDYSKGRIGLKVIGIKNVTDHAGATTLTYLLKNHLEDQYKVRTVEIGKSDFIYFNDPVLESINEINFEGYLERNRDAEVILVDVNDAKVEELCNDMIYLIEPGLIQLNRLIREDSEVFMKLKNKKIVLNRSVLSSKDVEDFEKESGSKVFYNLPYLDDKLDEQDVIKLFLVSLGFSRIGESSGNKIFNIFK